MRFAGFAYDIAMGVALLSRVEHAANAMMNVRTVDEEI